MKLTDGSISRLKPTKADAVYYDDDLPGFGLRTVKEAHAITWCGIALADKSDGTPSVPHRS